MFWRILVCQAVWLAAFACVAAGRHNGGSPLFFKQVPSPQPLPRIYVVGNSSASSPAAPSDPTAPFGDFAYFASNNGSGATAFVPRGANYIRLNGSQLPDAHIYHSTFSTKTYNGTEARLALNRLASRGYNVVRVFIDTGGPGRSDGIANNTHAAAATRSHLAGAGDAPGLNSQYLDNFADFTAAATEAGVYIIPTLDALPLADAFACQMPSNATTVQPGWPNNLLMIASCVEQKAVYVAGFLNALAHRLGREYLSTIMTLSLENEVTWDVSSGPWNVETGFVLGSDGQQYDLSVADERQAAADNSMRHWASVARRAVAEVDPGVVVSVGMFTFQAVHKNFKEAHGLFPNATASHDSRVPPRPAVLCDGALQAVSVHLYQTSPGPWSITDDMNSSDYDSLMPLISRSTSSDASVLFMEEFGAFRQNPEVFPTGAAAGTAMRKQQLDSCPLGFAGWLLWTYDTWEQPRIWNMVNAPEIFEALAPDKHAPCSSQ